MDDIDSLLNDIINTNFDVQTEHWVRITYITNPLDFYVRPTKYWALIERLESTVPQNKPPALKLHDVVMFNKNNSAKAKYARGKIFGIETTGNVTKYDIFALDYGCFCKAIPEEYIWECNQNYASMPPLAVACQLANCAAIGGNEWSLDSIDAFKYYVGDERTKMLILDTTMDKLQVELRNSNPDDIATLMALTGCSTVGYDHNDVSRFSSITPEKKKFTYKKFQVNDTLRVRLQSGRSVLKFYVMEVNDYKIYLKEYDKITHYAEKQPALPEDQMKKNTIVLVKNDSNKYERAIIQEVLFPDTTAKVKLVDTGIEELSHIMNMKTMCEEGLKLPVATILCSIGKGKGWNHVLRRSLDPGFEFLIEIIKLGDNLNSPYQVACSPLPYNPCE